MLKKKFCDKILHQKLRHQKWEPKKDTSKRISLLILSTTVSGFQDLNNLDSVFK